MSRESFDTSVLGEFFWNSTDLLSVLGSDGTWQIVNAAWPEQMGWTLEDLQSGPFIDLIHPDDVLATVREFDRFVAAPDATLIEFRNRQRRRDGSLPLDRVELSGPQRHGLLRRTRHHEPGGSRSSNSPGASRPSARSSTPWSTRSSRSTSSSTCSTSVPAPTGSTAFSKVERRGKNSLNIVYPEDRDHVAVGTAPTLPGEDGSLTNYHFRASARRRSNVDHRDARTPDPRRERVTNPAPCLVSRDVTEAVAAEVVLKEAKEAAERANAAKSEFMSRMSHELRTPLNSVLGFAQILEMELQSPDELEMVGYIHNSGKYLLELINEVLDISRIESGHISVMIEPIVLQDLEKECIELVKPQANEFGVTIFSQSDYDFQVLGDQQRLKQVLLNLLSNAIKYNRPERLGDHLVRAAAAQQGPTLGESTPVPGISPDLLIASSRPLTGSTPRPRASRVPVSDWRSPRASSRPSAARSASTARSGVAPRSGSSCPNVKSPKSSASRAQPTLALKAANEASSTVLYIEDDVANVQLVERLLMQRPEHQPRHVTAGRHGRRTGPAVPAGPHPARRAPHRHPRVRSARAPPGRLEDGRHPGRRTLGRRDDVAATSVPQRRRLRLPLQAARPPTAPRRHRPAPRRAGGVPGDRERTRAAITTS